MDYIASHAWVDWAALALVAAILEMALPSFAFLFIAVGAAGASASASLGYHLVMQSGVFTVLALSTLPGFRPRRARPSALPSRTEALIGLDAEVIQALEPRGRVVVNGEDWAAEALIPIAVGARVRVTGHDGIILNVEEL